MTPEAANAMQLAREALAGAEQILARTNLTEVTAREAYLAALHAARAVIFDLTGKVSKTHSGTLSEIGRLAQADARIDPQFAKFLKAGFDAKLHADYGEGRPMAPTADDARRFVTTATRLVAHAEWLLAQPEPPAAP
jgi:uncharacterized protein (UPF0332 family)